MANSSGYTLISADSHVLEPADLFTTRLPENLRDRAPKLVAHGEGSAWIVADSDPILLPRTALTGSGYRPGNVPHGTAILYDDILPALLDPAERIKAQNANSVQAEVLYPTPGLWDALKLTDDDELKLACARAYNDWIAEFCAHDPERLIGLGKVPTTSVEDAVAETRRCVTELKLRGMILDAWPSGAATGGNPNDDPFWETVNELEVPVSIHIACGSIHSTDVQNGCFPGLKPQMADAVLPLAATGVFDRFPKVKVVLAHADASWAIHWLEFSDIYHLRHGHLQFAQTDMKEGALPSEYIRSRCFFTFHHDRPAVRNRDNLGASHLMWASHFPYDDSNWPDDRQQAVRTTAEAPDIQAQLMGENVARLYRLKGFEDSFTAEAINDFVPLVHY